ncbi:MAG: pilus assembly protein PilM [Gammaproteobacteria bacterium]|nr:pilus assembly protein PilM [Gammaproteobacteria bacterium]
MLPYFSRSIVGLEIHVDEIRLLHLKKNRKSFYVANVAYIPLPFDAIQDGKIKQIETVYMAIKNLVEITKTKHCLTVISLPAMSVIMKNIFLSERAVNPFQEIELKLKEYLPGITEDLCFDFAKINSDKQNEVLLVASRLEQLNTYVAVSNEAGLKTKIVDVDCFALMRSVIFSQQEHIEAAAIILDVETTGTQLLIFKNKEILFKQYLGRMEIELMVSHIKRAIQICLTTYEHFQLKTIYLTNGFHLVSSTLADELGMNMILVNPFLALEKSVYLADEKLNGLTSRFSTSLGLAMRSIKG